MSVTPAELLEVAKAAAAAGAAVLATRNAEALDVSNKGASGDWVTAFDVAAENAVRQVINGVRPQDTVTGEEHGTLSRPEPSRRMSAKPSMNPPRASACSARIPGS